MRAYRNCVQRLAEVGNKNFDLVYLFRVNDNSVAIIKTGVLCFDCALGKALPLPAAFRARFE
mgnify:CR=1 FL=1